MFHKAVSLSFLEGTALEVAFQDGKVMRYDMASLFDKYPQLQALQDRQLFLSGELMGGYGIRWNDELDIEAETIYEEGICVRQDKPLSCSVGNAVMEARAEAGFSQSQLARITGIDQSDISRIERGLGNPSVSTLSRIADALGRHLEIRFTAQESSRMAP